MNPNKLHGDSNPPGYLWRVRCLRALLVLTCSWAVQAGEIDMRDYIHLSTGMNQAEVLYRVGPPDFQNTCYDCGGLIVNNGFNPYYPYGLPAVQALAPMEIWYYIPDEHNPSAWITEVIFDRAGRVFRLRRNRPYP
jgi:hypothetical protein